MQKFEGRQEYIYQSAFSPAAIASWFRATFRLWRDIAFRRTSTLYLVCSRSNFGFVRDIPALLAACAGTRVVVHAHGSDIAELLLSRPVSWLAKKLYARCELIVPSSHLMGLLECVPLAAVIVCENFAGTQSNRQTARMTESALTARLKVLWNSNIMASKGVFDLLEAVQILCADGTPIELRVIGSAISDEEMNAQEAEAALACFAESDGFSYLGRVPPNRAEEMVFETDVIALPSRYSSECQPLAVIDAMCAGRAVIVADTPALRATVGDYPVEFVPMHSIDAIVGALRKLSEEKMAHPDAFFAKHANPAAMARKRFSSERFDRQMFEFLYQRS